LVVRIEGSPADVEARLRDAGVHLTVAEAHRIKDMIGRDPSRTELYIFDIMWSEHCSYKSSRHVLKEHLPTEGSRVILGPGEDAGVVRLGTVDGVSYVLVVAHESHNHPSQILPVEGAATGIGGIVRDVYCMGADVVGVMDALRFGDPAGPRAESVKEIVAGVVRGIWEYGNALGVPNVGGDVFFDGAYDENCLVNVIALGVAREEEIIRSRVPACAAEEPYELLIIGKPTDMSGLGGATMASRILDVGGESGFSTVQIHDPFLKRVLTEATKSALEFLRGEGAEVGYKDLGAGGISCAVTEVVGAGGFGADIDLSKVHVASETMEAFAIACSETQERYCLAVPARLAARVAAIYNEDFELPHIYRGARASVVGCVTRAEQVVMRHKGEVVVDLPVELVTRGVSYRREAEPRPRPGRRPWKPEVLDLAGTALAVISMLSNASKHYIYRHYDSEVKGASVLKPGEADACVVAVAGTGLGIATSVDGNPRYSRLDAYLGAVHAVAEAARNVAAVGAVPITLTDCLNFGNPEDPQVFQDFVDTVRGIGDAARGLRGFDTGEPLPIVSGNVSFYNESQSGAAVPPSPIIACYGVLPDYSAAVTLGLKDVGDHLVHVGRRGADLGGSALYASLGREDSGCLPPVDLDCETRVLHAVIEIVTRRLARASHDISEGGLLTALVEMALGGWGTGEVGAAVDLAGLGSLEPVEALFSEGGGFVLEVPPASLGEVLGVCKNFGAEACRLGETTRSHELVFTQGPRTLLRLGADQMGRAYFGSLQEAVE
jgi:phosphoribosylformylglycinamidine synthase II